MRAGLYSILLLISLPLLHCGVGIEPPQSQDAPSVSGAVCEVQPDTTPLVTISGSGFVDGSSVTILGYACSNVRILSSTQLTCVLPNCQIALVNIVITTPSGGSSGGGGESGGGGGGTSIVDHHTIFATSTSYFGNLGGLTGADSKCAARAAAGSQTSTLGGTWRAILSDATQNARDRITFVSGYAVKNARGETVVALGSDLWGGTLTTSVRYDENNTAAAGSAWTGSGASGNVVSGVHCNSWTSSSGAISGNVGTPGNTNSGWISLAVPNCSNTLVLYCINSN